MKKLVITKQIGFTADPNGDVDEVRVTFTQEDIDRINSVVELVKDNKLTSAKIDAGIQYESAPIDPSELVI